MARHLILTMFFTLCAWGAAVTDRTDVVALEALKQSLDASGGKISWGRGDPCDELWDGIFCQNDRVTEIHLMNRGFTGTIAPHIGNMTNLQILNLMWNRISGTIPSTIGELRSLQLLLLNGNQLAGSIPLEVGNLINLNRLQVDENKLSGPIPSSFQNLVSIKHLHMNNNTLNGSIPPELGKLPTLFHLLVDNNNLSGPLPPQLADIPSFQILQLDNNNLQNSTIPSSYGTMKNILKLSMRNCNLQGPLPDFNGLPNLEYLDLSSNRLTEEISGENLPISLIAVDLSNNLLRGSIPSTFAHLEKLQVLLLQNNQFNGTISNDFLNVTDTVILNFQNNSLTGFSSNAIVDNGENIWLSGNPKVCNGNRTDVDKLCKPELFLAQLNDEVDNVTTSCTPGTCIPGQNELVPELAYKVECLCASPIQVTCRLKSPGFIDFSPFKSAFRMFMATGLELEDYQVYVASFSWQPGPRFLIHLKIFPAVKTTGNRSFNRSTVLRIFDAFASWHIIDSPLFGPREFMNFTPPYGIELFSGSTGKSQKSLTNGALAGIIIGVIAGTAVLVAALVFKLGRSYRSPSARRLLSRSYRNVKFDNVKTFSLSEMRKATDSFSRVIGRGGYGTVYKGVLADQQLVAIKRAAEYSHQGANEFFTEIELLSRIHHRNLVSLIGFCLEADEQLLVYEYVGGGSLHDRLSGTAKVPLSFKMRIRIALGAARGILYLHTEATPPIIHRDIKGTNILITEKNLAKVADFGLSRLAPEELVEDVSRHVSTVVKGTPGYLDPEYFLTRKLSDKSDVYSFGVVLMELITGKHAIYQGKNLVREVRQTYEAGIIITVVDDRMGAYSSDALEPLVKLALACCADTAENRPPIRTVVRDLEDIWKSILKSDPYHDNEDQESYSNATLSSDVSSTLASSSAFSRSLELVVPR